MLFYRIVGEAVLQGNGQQVGFDAHGRRPEYPWVHELGRSADDGLEIHERQDLGFEVDARRDLEELKSFLAQREHAAFGDVQHRLVLLRRVPTRECPLLHLSDELLLSAFLVDPQPASPQRPGARQP